MAYFDAIILGAIQGATEFIPISSSGHLVVAREFLGLTGGDGLAFDAILHFATALAIIVYFKKTWKELFVALYTRIVHKVPSTEATLAVAVLIGTLPAAFIGFFFADFFNGIFRTSSSVAVMLLIGSIALFVGEFSMKRLIASDFVTVRLGVIIGAFQVLALLPGMSRSGITMAGGMLSGLTREAAARFSFLLALPIVLGAGLVGFMKLGEAGNTLWGEVVVGAITAFVVGILAIHWLLKYIQTHSLNLFVVYRVVLAVLLLILL